MQEGGRLPTQAHIQASQTAIKNFCEDNSRSVKNEKSTFYGSASITFANENTRQIVVFEPDGSDLKSGYKLAQRHADAYEETGNIGEVPKK